MLWVLLSIMTVGAIVNGPLFSLDASGAVGKALVFTKWKGRNVVREYVKPANPKSILQRGRRTMIGLLNAIWALMNDTDRDSWADLAASGNYSNFNGFTSYNLDEQTVGDPPTKNRTDTPTSVTGETTFDTATGGNNRIDFNINRDVSQSGAYCIVALIEGTTSPGVDLLRGVAQFAMDATSDIEVAVTDLSPGTYSASMFIVTNDGGISTEQDASTSIVVTGV